MDYGMIGKIQKAKRYAEQRERFHVESLVVRIDGENNSHTVRLEGGQWSCDCDYFASHALCSHTMALSDHLLKDMVPVPQA